MYRCSALVSSILVALLAAIAVAPHASAEESPAELIEAAFRPSAVRYAKQKLLMEMGSAAVPALKKGLKHYFPHIRLYCVKLLSRMNATTSDLATALKDENASVRWAAGRYVVERGEKVGIDAMVSSLALTKSGERRAQYAKVLNAMTKRAHKFDWANAKQAASDREAEAWMTWWKSKRAAFKLPKGYHPPLDPLNLRKPPIVEDVEEEVEEIEEADEAEALKKWAKSATKAEITARIRELLEPLMEAIPSEGEVPSFWGDILDETLTRVHEVHGYKFILEVSENVLAEPGDKTSRDHVFNYPKTYYIRAWAYRGLGKTALAKTAIKRARILTHRDGHINALAKKLGVK